MIETYLKVDDVCAELGITKRQLYYWQDNGLFRPDRHGKYTQRDIQRVAHVRTLVVDMGLPLGFVAQLLKKPEEVTARLLELAQ